MVPAVTLGSCWGVSVWKEQLWLQHCSLWVYVHHTGGISSLSPISLDMSEDPYVMEEEEPSESRALESSLWEIQVCHPKMSI